MMFFSGIGLCIVLFVYTTIVSAIMQRERESMKDKILLLEPGARRIFEQLDYQDSQSLFAPSDDAAPYKIRFTLVAPRGEIIADSHSLPDTTVNGWRYAEVIQAVEEGWGEQERNVDVFGERTLIIAYAIHSHQKTDSIIGVIRAELPFSVIRQITDDVKITMLWVALVCALLACIFGYFMARLRAAPLAQMAEVCRAIRSGNYTKKVTTIPSDEMGELALTLNDLSSAILANISSLSLEKAQLKSMLKCMQEGIIAISDDGQIQFCNLAAYHHLGLNPLSDLREQNIQNHKELSPICDIWQHVLRQKHFKIKEIVLSDSASKEKKHLQIYATFYSSNQQEHHLLDQHSGVMVVLDNHSEIKRLQKMRRDFFAHASHELKTPLTSIQGFVEILLQNDEHKNTAIREKFLKKIQRNTQRMISLVHDLLALSRIDSQSVEVSLRPLQWGPVIQKVVENHSISIKKRNISLRINPQYNDLLVRADIEAMHTIFENLLINAIRYSQEKGTISIWLSKQKGHISLHITDDGVGIAVEHHEKIFERFYRVDHARSRQEGGTGLGLSIVKLLTEKLFGKVSIESKVGQGSTFSVQLPRVF